MLGMRGEIVEVFAGRKLTVGGSKAMRAPTLMALDARSNWCKEEAVWEAAARNVPKRNE